jgi:hypothetical protein
LYGGLFTFLLLLFFFLSFLPSAPTAATSPRARPGERMERMGEQTNWKMEYIDKLGENRAKTEGKFLVRITCIEG